MTGNSITVEDLRELWGELKQAADEINEIRMLAATGALSPHKAAERANAILEQFKKTTI